MAIPADLEIIHKEVTSEIVWGVHKLKEFEELYSSQKNVDLLNSTAHLFFRLLYSIWFDDMTMIVRRLLDKDPRALSLTNLIAQAKKHIDPETNEALCSEIDDRLSKVREESHAIKTHANKVVAHNEARQFSVDGTLKPFPPISRNDFRDVFKKMGELVNLLNGHFADMEQSWELHVLLGGGALDLIKKLESAPPAPE